MSIYRLYIKIHRKTGLKYLGYTKQKEYHKYHGSGKYWNLHLKKHGYDYDTKILLESEFLTEIKQTGIYYSSLWNIVESSEWANLKVETGEGGYPVMSQLSIEKRINTRRKNGNLNTNSTTSIAKALDTRKKNGTINTQTPDVVAKTMATKKKNGTITNPEIINKCLATKKKNGTLNPNSTTSIAKALATRKKNGTLNTITPASIKKANHTKKKIGVGVYEKIQCIYCGIITGKPQHVRWHNNNCKLKRIAQ